MLYNELEKKQLRIYLMIMNFKTRKSGIATFSCCQFKFQLKFFFGERENEKFIL